MTEASIILQKYWGHSEFRSLQQEIIDSVLSGADTFALMPTGGGKSVCFQVPAMMKDGLCLVISPLVALMKDQVQNLQARNIKAIALTGGISIEEVGQLLDNCQFGNYKFLYLSPERLQSDWIIERIKALPINLIAIDEAHCVSQWGHDFRPAYLKISKLKEHLPNIPFLALTASATERVQKDIITQLQLHDPVVFSKSFARKNIAYMVFPVEDKIFKIGQILKKNPQPSIIYVRNRKSCSDVAKQLQALGFTATFYHGGLTSKDKDRNMKSWMDESSQVIVATNAFGMGIDKANVRTVIHIQIPENLESYYQEAGRAGRNEERAYAIILLSPSDALTAESQFLGVLPDKAFLLLVYIKLCNYLRIAYGEGLDEEFLFNLNQFCVTYNLPATKVYNALQFLDRQGVVSLSQEFSEKITMQFIIESREVIRYMSLHSSDEEMMLAILRTYPGIYENRIAISLPLIAKKSKSSVEAVGQLLKKLEAAAIISYEAKSNDSVLIFNEVREDDRTINRVSKYLIEQNELKKAQLHAVLHYVQNRNTCRSTLILAYFGETAPQPCGICSHCLGLEVQKPARNLKDEIFALLMTGDYNSRQIQNLTGQPEEPIIMTLKEMLENRVVSIKPNNQYTIIK